MRNLAHHQEKNPRTLYVIHKRSWGHDRFYPYCVLSKRVLKLFKQKTFTIEQMKFFKDIGFDIQLLEEKIDL